MLEFESEKKFESEFEFKSGSDLRFEMSACFV